jgi:ATP/maltotriose-dependent transcriptional regulator MalT
MSELRDTSGLTARQMTALLDLVQMLSQRGSPADVVDLLRQLVPSDDVSRVTIEPGTRRVSDHCWYSVLATPAPGDDPELDDLFWTAYWTDLVCRYPFQWQSADRILSAHDFMSDRELARSPTGALFRMYGARHNLVVPLEIVGVAEHRIELFRADGLAYSNRERAILTLLRPHLALWAGRIGRPHATVLTARQRELLALVAAGLSNRDIAATLVLSEGTVRRHLDNIFQRLSVSNRTAAVTALRELDGAAAG